jgi:hypothetical protein
VGEIYGCATLEGGSTCSIISPVYLPHISPTSPPYLPYLDLLDHQAGAVVEAALQG